jgi:hypothetical protein
MRWLILSILFALLSVSPTHAQPSVTLTDIRSTDTADEWLIGVTLAAPAARVELRRGADGATLAVWRPRQYETAIPAGRTLEMTPDSSVWVWGDPLVLIITPVDGDPIITDVAYSYHVHLPQVMQ